MYKITMNSGRRRALGVPGYKVMRWEREWDVATQPLIKPAAYPELSVATTGTHDTNTMAEWWRAAGAENRRPSRDRIEHSPYLSASGAHQLAL